MTGNLDRQTHCQLQSLAYASAAGRNPRQKKYNQTRFIDHASASMVCSPIRVMSNGMIESRHTHPLDDEATHMTGKRFQHTREPQFGRKSTNLEFDMLQGEHVCEDHSVWACAEPLNSGITLTVTRTVTAKSLMLAQLVRQMDDGGNPTKPVSSTIQALPWAYSPIRVS